MRKALKTRKMKNDLNHVILITKRLILKLRAGIRAEKVFISSRATQVWQKSMLGINHRPPLSSLPCNPFPPVSTCAYAGQQVATKALDTQALTPVGHKSRGTTHPTLERQLLDIVRGSHEQRAQGSSRRKQKLRPRNHR